MKLNVVSRRVHYWAGALTALPVVVIICTGLLLQVKKQWSWVQPPEIRGSAKAPAVELSQMLASVQAVPELKVTGWSDVDRFDLRPGKGHVKFTLHSGWEVQVDIGTGKVLQTAYRRSDLIESLHDGSWFLGDITKLGLFLVSGVTLLVMWLTGLWMFWLPFSVKRRRKKAAAR